jgi:hypothetical protein
MALGWLYTPHNRAGTGQSEYEGVLRDTDGRGINGWGEGYNNLYECPLWKPIPKFRTDSWTNRPPSTPAWRYYEVVRQLLPSCA